MKKILLGLFVLVAGVALVACGGNDPLPNDTQNFWVTGAFAGWGDAPGNDEFLMEAAAPKDARLKSIHKQIKDAEWLVVLELTLEDEGEEWEVSYTIDGEVVTVNGNLAVKIIRTAKDDELNIPDFWIQSRESGKVNNLTPDTLYIPPYIEDNVENAGTWNDNPIAFEGGDYVVVLAEINDELHFGLIKK